MVFVRVDPAHLIRGDHEIWENKNMIRLIPQAPVLQLDRLAVVVADLHVFIRLSPTDAVVINVNDDDISTRGRRAG